MAELEKLGPRFRIALRCGPAHSHPSPPSSSHSPRRVATTLLATPFADSAVPWCHLRCAVWSSSRLAKDPRFERVPCTHKGTYADDCLVNRVTVVRPAPTVLLPLRRCVRCSSRVLCFAAPHPVCVASTVAHAEPRVCTCQARCYIVATCDKDLKRRLRKVPGVPIMYIAQRKYTIERMPEAFGGEASAARIACRWAASAEDLHVLVCMVGAATNALALVCRVAPCCWRDQLRGNNRRSQLLAVAVTRCCAVTCGAGVVWRAVHTCVKASLNTTMLKHVECGSWLRC